MINNVSKIVIWLQPYGYRDMFGDRYCFLKAIKYFTIMIGEDTAL